MERPQPMQAESTPIKIGAKRTRESTIPSSAKARRAESVNLPAKLKAIREARFKAGLTAHLELPQDHYYDEETIEKLVSQGKQLHAPGFIIFDPEDEDETLAMASSLKSALYKTEVVIIASTSVLYRALEAYESKNTTFEYFSLADYKFDLYQSPQSHFVIFVPKELSELYQRNNHSLGLNIKNLKNLSPLTIEERELGNKKYEKLTNHLKNYPVIKKPSDYSAFINDFSTIFYTKLETTTAVIWDFIITGHGRTSPPPHIAGMPVKEFNQFLTFFDKNLLVGTIIVDTCMAGGTNLNLLEFDEWGVKKNHPYILIITATTDSPVHGDYTGRYNYALNVAAWISDKGISLNRLLYVIPNISMDRSHKPLTPIAIPNNTLSLFIRESSAIPQVWLPNGLGFQTYNIDQYVLVINNVMARAAYENKKPIIVENKRVVLLYPPHIKAPLTVTTWKQKMANPQEMNLSLAKDRIWSDIPMTTEFTFWKNIALDKHQEITKILRTEYPFIKVESPELSYIFPQFISMMRGDTTQLIDGVLLAIDPAQGVMRFIRDAFLDTAERSSLKTFLIENLQGYNDISPLIHLSRTAKGIKEIHPLEKILAIKKDQAILLKDVLISTQFDQGKDIITVAFTVDNTAWQFTYDDLKQLWPQTHLWNFTPKDTNLHNNAIADIKQKLTGSVEIPSLSPQKSISETLQQKQQQILLKKAVEIKRKEATETAVKKYQER